MMTSISPPIVSGNQPENIAQAAQALLDGKLVAFPTETVYGLGADADQDAACRAVFSTKGRPASHPLIVHVTSKQAAMHYAAELPDFAEWLMEAFWPGPLTLIVKRKKEVGTAAAGGQNTIGLRCPSHPVALQLLHAFEKIGGYGIAAPSANRFGRTSPTQAQHVQQAFSDLDDHDIALILDGGDSDVGIESTIIDCSRGEPVLMRPGILTLESLQQVVKRKITLQNPALSQTLGVAPKASGTLSSHYAPKAKVRLMSAEDIGIALGMLSKLSPANRDVRFGVYARTLPKASGTHIIKRQMPQEAKAVAHELFSILHQFDADNVSILWIETPPDGGEWSGIRDRLERAAASD